MYIISHSALLCKQYLSVGLVCKAHLVSLVTVCSRHVFMKFWIHASNKDRGGPGSAGPFKLTEHNI